jgi:FKBP-type peptidyl-prolyl cis-trans isomerase (trigger factor)
MGKANHELYRKNHELHVENLRLWEENIKLRKKAEILKEEHQQLFSKLSNAPKINVPNNMLDLNLRLGPSPNASNAPNNMLDLTLRLGPSQNASDPNN